MKYKIFDNDLGDYIDFYDGSRTWELWQAKDLAWRKQVDFCDEDDTGYYYEDRKQLHKIEKAITAEEIGAALANFNYLLEEA